MGPAPPNATSAYPRGSTPRSTVTTRSAPSISWSAIAHDPGGGLRSESMSRLAPKAGHARARPASRSSLTPPGEVGAGGEIAEQQVRVGHGRLFSARSITGRPGSRSRRRGADPQRAAGVGPGDAPAAGADGVHVDHRELQHAAFDDPLRRLAHVLHRQRPRRRTTCHPCRTRSRLRSPFAPPR